jgi:basic membrane protein A
METKYVALIVIIIIVVAGVGAIILLGPMLFPSAPRVALILGTGGRGDLSFNDGTYAGALRAKAELGWNFSCAEPEEIADFETFLRDYAEAGTYDIIIAGSFDQEPALYKVAGEYPDQKFAIVDMYSNRTDNVASIVFNEHQGSALVGALAGLMTKTDKIGFVGGMAIPLINKFAAGFVWGANKTNPGLNYTISYTGNWVDTTTGQALADAMYAAGTDIIYAAAGRSGLGCFTSTRNKIEAETNTTNLWMIGVDSPQMWYGTSSYDDPMEAKPPTFVLTSCLKRVDIAVFEIIKSVYDGTFEPGIHSYDLANGGHDWEKNGLIPLGPHTDSYTLVEYDPPLLTLPQSIVDQVDALKAEIIANPDIVPDEIYWT